MTLPGNRIRHYYSHSAHWIRRRLPQALSNRGSVLIKGRRYPIAGRICMDQTMIDLGGTTDVEPGELVTLIGQDGTECITVDEVAELAQTIAHEILTGIAPRVPRIYM